MRGRAERSRIEQLEQEVISMRVMARRLFMALRARTGWEADVLFEPGDELRAADPLYDAVETVWERHRVIIVPCRTLLDPGGHMNTWPTQGEMYLGRWPDGSTRNLTRAQVLMMGGQDPDEERPAGPSPLDEVPF